MQIDGAVVGLAGLGVTLVGVIVTAAVRVSLAAAEVSRAAGTIDDHAKTLLAVQVVQGQHATTLAAHATEIAGLRQAHHTIAQDVTRLSAICSAQHGGE